MNPFRPISISLSPNTEKDDIISALKLLFQPRRWKEQLGEDGPPPTKLENEFKKYLGVKYAISFNSGRSAFLAILKCLGLKKNDQVLLQAFTCNAAVNPIIWADLKPVFVDCDERTFNIDIEDLKRKITDQSKAVMVQHTFGLSANLDEILEICRQNNLILIEDCAHALGAEYRIKKVGTFGKASFFSFSRDKIISSIYGGMAATDDENLAKKIRKYQEEIGYPSNYWIFQQLLHPILMNWMILPTYRILGKYLLILFQWLHVLSKAIHRKEKRGEKPSYIPKRLPEALAELALNQFEKLERPSTRAKHGAGPVPYRPVPSERGGAGTGFNQHRKEIANFYREQLRNTSFELPPDLEQVFLRFAVKHQNAHQIIKKAWEKNLLLGNWYDSPVAPHDTELDKVKYELGSCPNAEKLSKTTLNLPTHINISQKEAQKIVNFLKALSL